MDNDKEFIARANSLMSKFLASGMSIDEFLQEELALGRQDGRDYAEKLIRTFNAIDENYEKLQAARKSGLNRQDWIRKEIESEIAASSKSNGRDAAGKVLTAAIDVLNSDMGGKTPSREFDGIDAIEIISDIDKALLQNTMDSFHVVKEEENDKTT